MNVRIVVWDLNLCLLNGYIIMKKLNLVIKCRYKNEF